MRGTFSCKYDDVKHPADKRGIHRLYQVSKKYFFEELLYSKNEYFAYNQQVIDELVCLDVLNPLNLDGLC